MRDFEEIKMRASSKLLMTAKWDIKEEAFPSTLKCGIYTYIFCLFQISCQISNVNNFDVKTRKKSLGTFFSLLPNVMDQGLSMAR